MTARGPKPKPIAQRVAEGNPSKTALPEPRFVSGRARIEELGPPRGLPREAREFWKETVAVLVEVGIVDRVDVPVVSQLAVQFARIRQAQRILSKEGLLSTGSTGQVKEHPALKIERDATNLFLKLAEQYALTPVSRTRLGLAELHRQSLASDLREALPVPELRPVE